MSESTTASGITDEMVEAAAHALAARNLNLPTGAPIGRYWEVTFNESEREDYRLKARLALEAALAGCTVVALPPGYEPARGQAVAAWDVGEYSVLRYDDGSITIGPGAEGFTVCGEESELLAVALLAAVREARRLVSESGNGGDSE